MKIYISIPVRDTDNAKTRERADLIKTTLSRQGHRVLSPFDIYAGKNASYEDRLCYGLRAMLECDAVYFCEGWDKSCGCMIEYDMVMRFKAFGKKDFKIMMESYE